MGYTVRVSRCAFSRTFSCRKSFMIIHGVCRFWNWSPFIDRVSPTEDEGMKEFISKYEARIHGVLSCFDRMLFRGYLPIISGWQMAQFFNSSKIRFRELKAFLVQHAERVKQHAIDVVKQEGRPYQYLQDKIKKEDLAKQI